VTNPHESAQSIVAVVRARWLQTQHEVHCRVTPVGLFEYTHKSHLSLRRGNLGCRQRMVHASPTDECAFSHLLLWQLEIIGTYGGAGYHGWPPHAIVEFFEIFGLGCLIDGLDLAAYVAVVERDCLPNRNGNREGAGQLLD